MTLVLGMVRSGSTIFVPFNTFDSNDPSASVAIAAFIVGDIEIYKDGAATTRASDSGYTLLDTDGIDFDGHVGIGGFSVDLADNDDNDFYTAGSRYFIVVGPTTVDAGVVNFVAATFEIGYPDAIINTTIATLASQVSFTLTVGPAEAGPLIGCPVLVHDQASAVQIAIGYCSAYDVTDKTVTLKADPGIFTMAAGDNVSFFMPANVQAVAGTTQTAGDLAALITTLDGVTDAIKLETDKLTLGDAGTGSAGSIIEEIENRPTTAMRGTDNVVLSGPTKAEMDTAHNLLATTADLLDKLGAVDEAAAAGDPSATESVMQYVKQLINLLIGSTGVGTNPSAAVPADGVNIFEILNSFQARLPDALVNSRMDSSLDATGFEDAAVDKVWDEARSGHTTAGSFGDSFQTIVSGAAEAGTLSTTQMTTDLTEATNEHYNGRVVIWTSGVLKNQASDITAYLGATGELTYTAVTEAPSATDTFIIV